MLIKAFARDIEREEKGKPRGRKGGRKPIGTGMVPLSASIRKDQGRWLESNGKGNKIQVVRDALDLAMEQEKDDGMLNSKL